MMFRRVLRTSLFVCALVVAGINTAYSEQLAAADCRSLLSLDLSGIPDAPAQLMSSVPVPAGSGMPAHCVVRGYVNPNVGFEIKLPLSQWNGKFFHAGCGGYCGRAYDEKPEKPIFQRDCDIPVQKGYACITSDSGHKSGLLDLNWAYNNTQALIDYAYRATHVATLAGKAIVKKFYQADPGYSYFMGCSGGGREGMVEAQRFPWDFDGVVVVAPSINITGNAMRLLWTSRALQDAAGPVLKPEDLRLLYSAALSACDGDGDDGVVDGIIGDPSRCHFDPASVQCGRDRGRPCLSAGQVAAARTIYAGPRTSQGKPLFTGGNMPGSELGWLDTRKLAGDIFRYSGFVPSPGPAWNSEQFDFDTDYKRFGMMESLMSATNPDLRQFKAKGGKLIAAQGWSDTAQVGMNIIDYYQTVQNTMGGRAQTEDFFRLFMLPGVGHCEGGAGADAVDYIAYLEKWVERGEAPAVMLSVRRKAGAPLVFPLPSDSISFSRPLYPYPARARYAGKGDANDAANFMAVE